MRRPLSHPFTVVGVLLLVATAGCDKGGMDISHPVASRADDACRVCHDSATPPQTLDVPGAQRVQRDPVDHSDRDDCTGCHAVRDSWLPLKPLPQAVAKGDPTPIPHEAPRTSDAVCQDCHATGIWNAPVTAHTAFTGCIGCHQ